MAAKSYDPCALVTTEDVAALFPGRAVKNTKHQTKPSNPLGQKICFYDAGDMHFVQLSVMSAADKGVRPPSVVYQGSKSVLGNKIRPVADLGEDAYYGGSGLRMGAGLHVLAKDVAFVVMVGLGSGNRDEALHLEIEKKLARKVLDRF